MICRFFKKNVFQKSLSSIVHKDCSKSLLDQFNEKKSNPEFLKHFNEIQEKILDIKTNPHKYEVAYSQVTIQQKNEESQELENRKHSIY